MLQKIKIAVVVACLGICTGLGAHYLLNKEDGKLIEKPLQFTMPEEGVKTDAFSLRLFQTAVEHSPQASVMVSPALLCKALQELAAIAETPIQQELAKLNLPSRSEKHTVTPLQSILLATDFNLNYHLDDTHKSSLMRLPFSTNLPMALELFNSTLVHTSDLPQEVFAKGKIINRHSRFVVGLASGFTPIFQVPFLSAHATTATFENANGSLPNITMLQARGSLRHIKDTEGKWEAIALPLQPNVSYEETPTVLIGILPTHNAEKMALSLTTDELSHIRQKLLEAPPTDCTVCLPQMVWSPPLHDMHALLSGMGMDKLFDTTAKNWRFADQELGISVMVEKLSLSILPQKGDAHQQAKPENAPTVISFDRPFIWLVGDLTTDTPPYFMGLLQNL